MASTRDPIELYRLIYQALARQMDASIFFIGLYDPGWQTFEVVWQVEHGKELSGGSFPLGTGLSSDVVLSGQSRLIRHWSEEGPRIRVQYATETPGLPESAVAAPLRVDNDTIGIMSVQSYAREAYTERDLALLEAVATYAAPVIASLHYSELATVQVWRRLAELESVLASMADALLITDRNGALVRLNRAARELLCVDETSIVFGHAFDEAQWQQWAPAGRAVAEALRPIIDRLQTIQEPEELEVEIPGQTCRVLSFRATPLHDAEGAFNGGVIVFRDITTQRLVERLKHEMLSIASHDLKTPATVIKAEAQLLRRRFDSGAAAPADVEEGLAMIAEQADRLAKLLNLLLDVSRVEAGQVPLDRAPTDLQAVLTSMARALQATTDSHIIEVHAPGPVIGLWDPRRVEEVVQNLLSNAVKYSPVGTRVEVTLESDGVNATITVRDSGIGLSKEDAPHVFERYYRGAVSRRLEGVGLGLYICHAIVTAHGGRIWAESNGPGQGSTFAFSLPLSPPAAAPSDPPRAP